MKESKRIERRADKHKKENSLLFLNIKAKNLFLRFEGNAIQAYYFIEDMVKTEKLAELGYISNFVMMIELELQKHGVLDSMFRVKDEYKEQIESFRK